MGYRASKFVVDETGALAPMRLNSGFKGWIATLLDTDSASATVLVEVSNDGDYWSTLKTFSLTEAGTTHEITEEPFLFHRFNVTALASGAKVLLSVSNQ